TTVRHSAVPRIIEEEIEIAWLAKGTGMPMLDVAIIQKPIERIPAGDPGATDFSVAVHVKRRAKHCVPPWTPWEEMRPWHQCCRRIVRGWHFIEKDADTDLTR